MPPSSSCPKDLSFFQVVKATFSEWSEDDAARLAAAFAYYAIFSIGPLLLIAMTIVSLIYGPNAEQDQIRPQIAQFVGDKAADLAQEMLKKARESAALSFTGIISVVLILYAATNLFATLQGALNTIFDVQTKPGRGVKDILKDRAVTFLMVLLIGAFILASIVLNTMLSNLTKWGSAQLLGDNPALTGFLLQLGSFLVSALVFTGVFALIFKYLPDIKIDWKDTLIGAAATSILFTLARIGLSLYLSRSSTAGPFGAAGSLVIIMLFIYYSAQVLFLGAEFTQIWACRSGTPISPADNALALNKKFLKRHGSEKKDKEATANGTANGDATNHWWSRVAAEKAAEVSPGIRHNGRQEDGKTKASSLAEDAEEFPLDDPYPASRYHPPMS